MARTELAMFACVHGTIFGMPGGAAGEHDHRVVVPEPVGCRRRLDSVLPRRPGGPTKGCRRARRSPRSATRPIPLPATVGGSRTVDEHRTRARDLASHALIADGQRRIQRNRDQLRARRRQQGDDEFGVAAEPQRDPVPRAQTTALQLPGQVVNQPHQLAVADRYAIGGDDERRRLAACGLPPPRPNRRCSGIRRSTPPPELGDQVSHRGGPPY